MKVTSQSRSHRISAQPAWADEMAAILDAYQQAGGDPQALQLPEVATLVISENRVLAEHEIPGIHFESLPLEHGVQARIFVEPQARIERPVHLCFGVLPSEGKQEILADYEIGAGAQVQFLAHCSFPNAVRVEHTMQARIHLGAGASLTYTEEHFHGPHGGVNVRPQAEVIVEAGARFSTTFSLTRGRVGTLDVDYQIDVADAGVAELMTKAYGTGEDRIRVQEIMRLNGEQARGLTRTRIAVRDSATSQVYTTMEGNAPGARGHMDCTEIVRGQAQAHNEPLVIVRNDQAQVTHEAAIGTVNRKELETLLARGLDEDEAVDLIIRGMIR
jgi:Fe-S cluster assembly scaffold protein SufB